MNKRANKDVAIEVRTTYMILKTNTIYGEEKASHYLDSSATLE